MEKLGINTVQLLAQLVNVGVLLLILKKFLYKPVLSLLAKRKQDIESGLRLQQQMEGKIKKLEEKEQQLTRNARANADKLAKKAREEAMATAAGIVAEARATAEKVRKQARADAKKQLAAEAAKLDSKVEKRAFELANEALTKFLGKDTQAKLTEAQIKSVAKGGR